MRGRRFLALPVIATLGAACAHYPPEPLSVRESATSLTIRSLDDPALLTFVAAATQEASPSWPPTALDSKALALVALWSHPALSSAAAGWAAARAAIVTAAERPNPRVSILPEYAALGPGIVTPWYAGIDLSWTFETAGKRDLRVVVAERMAESARLELRAVARRVVRDAVESTLVLDAAVEHLARSEAQANLSREIRAAAIEREKAGSIARPERLASDLAAASALQDLSLATSQSAEARAALAASLGLPQQALDGFSLHATPPAPTDTDGATPESDMQGALTTRPDVLALLARYGAADASLQLEVAKQIPDLQLGPGFVYDLGVQKWALAASFDLPLLNQNEGPVAEASARRKVEAVAMLALQGRILAEVEAARTALSGATNALIELEHATALEEERMRAAERSLAAGAVDRTTWLAARLSFERAADARDQAEARAASARASLDYALGLPFSVSLARAEDILVAEAGARP